VGDRPNYLVGAEAHIESRIDVDHQLRLSAAESGQRPDRDQLSLAIIQIVAGVYVPESELDHITPEIGGDVGQGVEDRQAVVAVDLPELGGTSSEALWSGATVSVMAAPLSGQAAPMAFSLSGLKPTPRRHAATWRSRLRPSG